VDFLAVSDFNLEAILVVNSINIDPTLYTSCTPQTTPILYYLACFIAKTRANGLLRISVFIMTRRPSQWCLLVVSGFGFYHLWIRIWDMGGGVVAAYERGQSHLPPSNGAKIPLQEPQK